MSQLSKPAITVTAPVTLLPPSLPQLPPAPQQPNHVFCHIILWLVGVVPFSTKRNMFFCTQTLPACRHFRENRCFYHFFLHQMHSKRDDNVSEKVRWTLFIISPLLLGLSTQFKNWYIGFYNTYSGTETHWGCVSLPHLKSVT